MALTLDGSTVLPNWGNNNNSGAGVLGGAGAGLLGGGIAGVLGGMLGGALLGGNRGGYGNNGYGAGYPVAAPATTAIATDIVLNPAFQSVQNQVSNLAAQVASGDLNNTLQSEFRRLNLAVDGNMQNIGNDIANLSTAQATSAFTTLQSINGLGRDVTAAQNQAALQQLNSFNNLTTTTLQGFNSSAMQIQNSTNQIIAQGVATAMQMANCCCEIKGMIMSDGNMTRALINQLDKENLQAQLADAKNQADNLAQSIAFQTSQSAQTTTILQHIVPLIKTGTVVA